MNKLTLKSEISDAVNKVAKKHGVQVQVKKIETAQDHMETTLVIKQAKPQVVISRSMKALSRKQQVEKLVKKGITSTKKIVETIGSHPSYISRLLGEIRNENPSLSLN